MTPDFVPGNYAGPPAVGPRPAVPASPRRAAVHDNGHHRPHQYQQPAYQRPNHCTAGYGHDNYRRVGYNFHNGVSSVSSSSSPPASTWSGIMYQPHVNPSAVPLNNSHGIPVLPAVSDYRADYSPLQPTQDHSFRGLQTSSSYALQRQVLLQPETPHHHNNNNNNISNNNIGNNNNNIGNNNIGNNNNNDFSPPHDLLEEFKPAAGSSSSRQMRNIAEKQRRDKINTCIAQLLELLPFISSKKIEKTSVLRLSAAFLRLSRLLMGLKEQREVLPVYINKINLADLMLDNRDIYLMVTSTGKIVFVSHSVESILGHSQIDLMGQSLLNITRPEDHDELRNNLKYQEDESSSSNIISTGDTLSPTSGGESCFKVQRRSFYVRLVKKAASRGEQPDFELVHVVGTLMVQNSSQKNSLLGGNDIILNAVVRPYNERRVTEVSMLEATREEYITRHQIDSRIIYVDHRISIVSGFMPQEVTGQLAFTYMHKDDVRWVMIALRQMYFKGQSFGKSCYKLLSKNGKFVYMTTHGYLELNPNEDSIQSFMCINTLISPEEGIKEIKKMKERFTPIILTQSDSGIAAITDNQYMDADSPPSSVHGSTEDPKTLNKVVKQIITDIPAHTIDNVKETAQNPLPELQYIMAKQFSESMPPVSPLLNAPKIDKQSSTEDPKTINKVIKQIVPDIPAHTVDNVKETAQNPLPELQYVIAKQISDSMPPAPPSLNAPKIDKQSSSMSPQPNIKAITQDRPFTQDRATVLQIAPPIARQTVVVQPPSNKKTAEKDHQRRGEILVVPKRQNDLSLSEHSPKRAKIVLESQINSPTCSQYSNQFDGSQSDNQLSTDGYCSLDSFSNCHYTPIDEQYIYEPDPLTDVNIGLEHFSETLDDGDALTQANPLIMTPESYNSYDNDVYNDGIPTDIIDHDPLMHALKHDGNIESEMLEEKQNTLKNKMDQQKNHLRELQTELNSLPPNADTHFLNTNLSNLQAAYEQQRQLLSSLKGARHNIDV